MENNLHTKICLTYLAIPNLLFYFFWLNPLSSLILSPFLIYIVYIYFPIQINWQRLLSKPVLIGICCVLFVTAFSGCAHIFFANYDWYVRDAVYADLIKSSWPVKYADHVFLRAPTGYYLLPSFLSAYFNYSFVWTFIFWQWTALGLILALWPIIKSTNVFLSVVVFLLFSGADWLGFLMVTKTLPSLGSPIEWWARKYQYSSFMTSMLWVPNHALPAFIIASLFCKQACFKEKTLSVFLSALWSPFVFISGVLLLSFTAIKKMHDAKLVLSLLILFLPVFVYLSQDINHVSEHGFLSNFPKTKYDISLFVLFVLLQVGPFIVLILQKEVNQLLLVSMLILIALPLFCFGPGNDLVMRVSLMPLFVLYFYLTKTFYSYRKKMLYAGCLFLLFWSSPTPINELYRVWNRPVNIANYQQSTSDAVKTLREYTLKTEHLKISDPTHSYLAHDCTRLGKIFLRSCHS